MPPNQQVMGGCNQIISLRFGFPNSFPLILSTDHSLALKKGDGGRQNRGEEGESFGGRKRLQDKVGQQRGVEREDMIEE